MLIVQVLSALLLFEVAVRFLATHNHVSLVLLLPLPSYNFIIFLGSYYLVLSTLALLSCLFVELFVGVRILHIRHNGNFCFQLC